MKQESAKPLILVTNDDGYEAKGLAAIVEVAKKFGEVVVVAPDGPRSGMAHAITMHTPLRINKYREEEGVTYYKTNGTPVDCVKVGQKVVLRNRKIDLVLSGINHGQNSSVSVIYSATMAAAIEASFENVPAIGLSLLNYDADADFTTAQVYAEKIIDSVLSNPIPSYMCLNVNIPDLPVEEIKGIKVTRQTMGYWNEDLEERVDPFGHSYYWLSGHLVDTDPHDDTCQWALMHNYVSVQPVQFDMTAHQHITKLKFIEEC